MLTIRLCTFLLDQMRRLYNRVNAFPLTHRVDNFTSCFHHVHNESVLTDLFTFRKTLKYQMYAPDFTLCRTVSSYFFIIYCSGTGPVGRL